MEDNKKSIFPVNAESKSSVVIFLIALALIVGLTFSLWGIWLINIYAVKLCLTLLVTAAYAAVAVVAMKLTAQEKKLLPTKNRLWLQFLIGVAFAAVLCFLM